MSITRGSLGFIKRYPDVIDYASKNIPGFYTRTVRENLPFMNELFGTNFTDNSLIEEALLQWQVLLLKGSQPDKNKP